MKYPEWILPNTKKFLEYSVNGFYEGEDDSIEKINRCVFGTSPSLKRIWNKFAKLYPNNPDRGQELLAEILLFSLPSISPRQMFFSESEAEKWKEDISFHLNKVIELTENRPLNYPEILPEMRKKHSRSWKNTFHDYLEIISKAKFNPFSFGKWVKGDNADRRYFVRFLSLSFKVATGEYKRSMVSTLTSTAFECEYSEPEVVRATKEFNSEDVIMHLPRNLGLSDEEWARSRWYLQN